MPGAYPDSIATVVKIVYRTELSIALCITLTAKKLEKIGLYTNFIFPTGIRTPDLRQSGMKVKYGHPVPQFDASFHEKLKIVADTDEIVSMNFTKIPFGGRALPGQARTAKAIPKTPYSRYKGATSRGGEGKTREKGGEGKERGREGCREETVFFPFLPREREGGAGGWCPSHDFLHEALHIILLVECLTATRPIRSFNVNNLSAATTH